MHTSISRTFFTDIAPLPALAWQSSSMPYTPIRAYSEYNPIELIVDCATLPSPQASPSSSSIAGLARKTSARAGLALPSQLLRHGQPPTPPTSSSPSAWLRSTSALLCAVCALVGWASVAAITRFPRRMRVPRTSQASNPALTARAVVRVCGCALGRVVCGRKPIARACHDHGYHPSFMRAWFGVLTDLIPLCSCTMDSQTFYTFIFVYEHTNPRLNYCNYVYSPFMR
ncbi:hypothetical protein EDB83DRAFT_2677027 [Lactarius deliciosus]|nr:hypothetical protein EDB83DRAFT_2677027 [Lactarius deliciosus]